MKGFILGLLLTLFTLSSLANDFSIFLVRHAEKQADSKNPSLTHCGNFRAKQLATMLELTNIEEVYSTPYKRTQETATPTAKAFKLPVKHYAPNGLEQFSLKLIQQQKNVLVVGHSNTTPQLTRFLSGKVVEPLTEKDYQMLYQIKFVNDKVSLTLLKQPLICR